jgi:hypothetical protein
MAWREPVPTNEEPDPVAELLRPRTWSDAWRDYADEQAEHGDELPEGASDFNLNLEMH